MKKYTSAQLVARMNPAPVQGPVAEYAPGDVIPGMGKVIAVGGKAIQEPAPERDEDELKRDFRDAWKA